MFMQKGANCLSVPKNQRKKSSKEFFYNAYKLNDEITTLLLRDFGVKSINRDLKTFTHSAKMSQEDRCAFNGLCAKYNIDVETEYPAWLLDYYREWILQILREFINNLTQANTIYPGTREEYLFRKKYQWMAQGNCYQLLQALQTAVRVLPVDAEKYMPYVGKILDELESIKNWKKSDAKRFRHLLEKVQ